MKVLVSHPTGNANLRAAIQGIDQGNNLAEFHTCIAADRESSVLKLLPQGVKNELLRRSFDIDKHKIKSHPFKEFARLALPRLGITKLNKHESGLFSVDSIYRSLDHAVGNRIESLGNKSLDMVYAYEDGALSSFEKARLKGILSIYDLPIGYWKAARRLLSEEMDSNPAWANTLTGFKDSQEKLSRKDQELALADHIFVASSFTKQTLEDYDGNLNPVHVIPYGFPDVSAEKNYRFRAGQKLKLLFVGGLSQRKGISYMLDALKEFKEHVELTIIGRKPVPNCDPLNQATSDFNWIESLPHAEILKVMREHDVLLFPSLFEGFGLVVTEAMSQGVPVITTERTCGPDLIDHGQNGWIVRAGQSESIVEVIDNILQQPELVEQMGQKARITASERPWSAYGKELNTKLESIYSGLK